MKHIPQTHFVLCLQSVKSRSLVPCSLVRCQVDSDTTKHIPQTHFVLYLQSVRNQDDSDTMNYITQTHFILYLQSVSYHDATEPWNIYNKDTFSCASRQQDDAIILKQIPKHSWSCANNLLGIPRWYWNHGHTPHAHFPCASTSSTNYL